MSADSCALEAVDARQGARADAQAFVLANTTPAAMPFVPELRLHLAGEAHELWHRTERALDAAGLPPPFWAFAWAGGLGLARHVLDTPALVRGRRVLDFASGSGLVAIAAAKAGAARVQAADIDPFAQAAIALNGAANGVDLEPVGLDLVGRGVEADLALAGDVFYDRPFAERLVSWFDRLAAAGVEILVGDPGRRYLPAGHASPVAALDVPTSRALEDADAKRVTIWRWHG